MGDMKGRLGKNNTIMEKYMDREGKDVINDNGRRLIDNIVFQQEIEKKIIQMIEK